MNQKKGDQTADSAEFRIEFPTAAAVLERAVASGEIPGAVAGVEWGSGPGDRHGGSLTAATAPRIPLRRIAAFGQRRLIPSTQPMLTATIFDLASLTKIMGTAALTARLVDRGWIDWETPLHRLLPGAAPGLRGTTVRVRHLLSHTAGYTAWEPLWEKMRARFAPRLLTEVAVAERQLAMRELVLAIRPDAAPGDSCVYSDISFLLLGFALEEVLQMPLDLAVEREVFRAMGLRAFYRRVDRELSRGGHDDRVAATEDCPWRGGVLQGQVHDDNCWSMGGYAGHAGVFGTAADVLDFARDIQGNFLSRATRQAMWTRVSAPAGCTRTLGWDTPSGPESSAGRHFQPGTVGHLGFTGTSLWIDREAGVTVTLLTNRVHPSRETSTAAIKRLRPEFHDAVREDLRR